MRLRAVTVTVGNAVRDEKSNYYFHFTVTNLPFRLSYFPEKLPVYFKMENQNRKMAYKRH